MRPHDEAWRVRVTGRDVGAAAEAWRSARASGASRERLVELWDDLLRLQRALAVQPGEDRADRPGDGGPATSGGPGRGDGPAAGGGARPPARDGVVPRQRDGAVRRSTSL